MTFQNRKRLLEFLQRMARIIPWVITNYSEKCVALNNSYKGPLLIKLP